MSLLPEPRLLALTVDRPIVRIALAAFVGLPAAAFVFFFGWLGLALPFYALKEGYDPLYSASLLSVSTLGFLGVVGGWVRLLIRHAAMSERVRYITVGLLLCGVLAAVCFEISMFFGEIKPVNVIIAVTSTVVAVIGLLFIHATPAVCNESNAQPGVQEGLPKSAAAP